MSYLPTGIVAGPVVRDFTVEPIAKVEARLPGPTPPEVEPRSGYGWCKLTTAKPPLWPADHPGGWHQRTGVPCGTPPARMAKGVTWTPSPMKKLEDACKEAGVPPASVKLCASHLSRGKSLDSFMEGLRKKEIRERRPEKLAQQCLEAGVPPDLVVACVERLLAGKSMDRTIEELQAMVMGVAPPKKFPWLLVGGLGIGAIALVLVLKKKKRKP
jgi:hypothetical protein